MRTKQAGTIAATLIAIMLTAGCAGGRTKYHPADGTGGYSENLNGETYVSRFAGNAYTNSDDAKWLSIFRSVEICSERNKVSNLLESKDLSTSKTIQKSTANTYTAPVTVSGSSTTNANTNCYGGNCYGTANTDYSGTAYGGSQSTTVNTWNETYHFPIWDTVFQCQEKVFKVGVDVKPVTAADMNPYVKDLMGAIQVSAIAPKSPNKEVLRVGDIITKVDGNRVENGLQFVNAIQNPQTKGKVTIQIVRDGKPISLKLMAVDDTATVANWNHELINKGCSLAADLKARPICGSKNRAPASAKRDFDH